MASLKYALELDASQATRAISDLKGALTGLASAFALRELAQFADGITSLRNRLLTLNPDVQLVNQQFKALASIALEARTPLNATADLFYRISRSSKELGISQREAAQITESVAKALSASGQSAAEASGPLLQLGQALQSGTFQGDELRSILEGLQPVAKALADELGVPIGALKKLGSEGQISADVFVRAMRRAKDSIDEAFGRTTPTISQALTSLKTNAALIFDEFEKNTKTGQNLALSIEYIGYQLFKLSKNIDDIIEPLTTFLKVVGSLIVFTVVGRALSVLGGILTGIVNTFAKAGQAFGFAKDILLNLGKAVELAGSKFMAFKLIFDVILKPLGAVVGLLMSGAAAIYAWSGLGDLIDKFKSLGDKTSEGGRELADYREELRKMREGLDDTAGESENARLAAEQLAKGYARLRMEAGFESDRLNRTLVQERSRLQLENDFTKKRIQGFGATEDQLAVEQALQRIAQERYNQTQQINNQIEKLSLEYNQLVVKDSQRGKELQNQIAVLKIQLNDTISLYNEHEDGMARLIQDQLNLRSIEEARKKINEDLVKSIESQMENQQRAGEVVKDISRQISDLRESRPEFALLGFTELEKQFIKIEDDAKRAAQRAQEKFASEFGEVTPINADAFEQGLKDIENAYKDLVEVQKQFAKENYEITRSFEYGWKNALSNFVEETRNAGRAAERIFNRTVQGMEDLFVNFAKTGKFEWKNFLNSLGEEILRSQLRQLFGSIFGGMTDAMDSGKGFMGVLGQLLGFGGGTRGSTASNPLFVVDATRGGGGAASQGGGILDTIIGGVKSIGSSIWDGIKSIGSSVLGIFGGGGGSSGGGFLSSIVKGIGSLFGGFFANGGTLGAGRWGIAGERGPELITGPATVTPMMGQTYVTYNIQAMDALSFKQMVARDPSFIHAVAQQGSKGITRRY